MDKESVDFKILGEMQQGSMITVLFDDDTKVTGQVSEKLLVNNAYDDEDGYYFFKIKFGGDCILPVDSREIKGIERCITCDAGLITGRAIIEKYNISCNRYMGNVITEVNDKWDELDDTAKEEISKVLSSSMNQYVMKDMIDAMRLCKQYNTEQREKIMKLLEEKKEEVKNISAFFDKYRGIKKYLTKEYATVIDWILFDYCGLKKALAYNVDSSVNERKDRVTVQNDVIVKEATNVR